MEAVSEVSYPRRVPQRRVSPEIYTRLFRVLFSSILKISGVTDCTASLGNLLQGLSPEIQGFPYIQSLFFRFMPVASHSPAMYHCEKLCHIFLMTDLLVSTGRLLLSPSEALSSPCWNKHFPQFVLTGQVHQLFTILVALWQTSSGLSMFFLYRKTHSCVPYSRWGVVGRITSLNLLTVLLVVEPSTVPSFLSGHTAS